MKNFVYAISLIIFGFVLNLLLFFFNDTYREKIKNLKHKEESKIENLDEYNSVENLDNSINENIGDIENINNDFENIFNKDKKTKEELDKIRMQEIENELLKSKINDKIEAKKIDDSSWNLKEKTIGFTLKQKTNIDFVKWIFKKFDIKKVEKDDELFYITTEYPNNFLQYNGNHLILYFFENTDFEKNLEIFDALSYVASFNINQTNSFGDKSFYINKIKADGFVRLVIKYKNITFGLQVDKKYFNDVKNILKTKLR